MKTYFLILFILPLSVFGQVTIEGIFSTGTMPPLTGIRCLKFNNSGSFEDSFCNWKGYYLTGKGIYFIENDTLILKYISSDTLSTTYQITDSICLDFDSLTLNIYVMDKETDGFFLFNNIIIIDSANDTVIKKILNNEGIITCKVKKSNEEYTLNFSNGGYKPCSFKFNPDNCKEIKIFPTGQPSGVFQNGTISKYRIIKLSADTFEYQINNTVIKMGKIKERAKK
jgi:hypothetical protein